jgi:hypothetical protein
LRSALFFLLFCPWKVEVELNPHRDFSISPGEAVNPGVRTVAPNVVAKSSGLLSSKMGRSIAAFIAPEPIKRSTACLVAGAGVDLALALM